MQKDSGQHSDVAPWELASPSTDLSLHDCDVAPIAPAQRESRPVGGGLWTIPLLCMGLAIIAACVIVPATDENRRLAYERERLKADLEQISRQIDVNDEFLKRIGDDPTLAERLAQRQM